MKLMTKKSTCFRRFTESCRWCDCSNCSYMEWTWEGGSKEFVCSLNKCVAKQTLVMPNGISARYQGKAYDSTCEERVHIYASI